MDTQPSISEAREVHPGLTCPMCCTVKITTSWRDHTFTYGSGESAVQLKVQIPVRRCTTCDFDFLDHEAERLKHQALCEHFGVLAPVEIRMIRKSYQMSRARFSEVTGLGEASLNRWENGINIQTHANDRYLRLLLVSSDNMWHLEELVDAEQTSPVTSSISITTRFPNLKNTALLRDEGKDFQLHKQAA